MTSYEKLRQDLLGNPRTWLVTGVAGFIGSHLLEVLLRLNQTVIGVDNFITGRRENLQEVELLVEAQQWARFQFLEGDIADLALCSRACKGANYVLHQAALGSVPRSIQDPISTNCNNVTGFLNMLVAARDQGVSRFVYASSSSVYGDEPGIPKVECKIGRLLSPYAVTKLIDEIYADVFSRTYPLETIGLRYFNVFGPRQDPNGPYAAVIPRWIDAMLKNVPLQINGDGTTSRDFCYIMNTVQANLLAATTQNPQASNQVFNVALNQQTTLNQLFFQLRQILISGGYPGLKTYEPVYADFRSGDVTHSRADITKAQNLLGYAPTHGLEEGLASAVEWFKHQTEASRPRL